MRIYFTILNVKIVFCTILFILYVGLDVHEQCKGKNCGTHCVIPDITEAACDGNEQCIYAEEARKGCQGKEKQFWYILI